MTDDTRRVVADDSSPRGSWVDLADEVWSYLTTRGASIDYTLQDMTVEVPRDVGPDAPRATWRLNGTLRISTNDTATGPDSPTR
ncbi:hypothetical protein [Arthrobacter sp. B1805]|uniref:hypothetical protein n=1 Tax=Arthrobacter sp. B1805 TaxID=2058892 RepID=UPI000CE2F639|nr:hypothetical protein [Arthrobacter sp. B1805]